MERTGQPTFLLLSFMICRRSAVAGPLGPVGADVVALGICAAVNITANRRVTFAQRGRAGRARQYQAAGVVAALPLVATVAALVALRAAGVSSLAADLFVLTLVNAAVAILRFVLLRRWVFAPVSGPGRGR